MLVRQEGYEIGTRLEYRIQNVRMSRKKVETTFSSPKTRYPNVDPNAKSLMICPTVEIKQRAIRIANKKMICKFTFLSSAVRFIGAAVAFCINLVSCPVKITIPYTQGVFRSVAP
jgi:hypothetical protein